MLEKYNMLIYILENYIYIYILIKCKYGNENKY
jgi:hypothetical protein